MAGAAARPTVASRRDRDAQDDQFIVQSHVSSHRDRDERYDGQYERFVPYRRRATGPGARQSSLVKAAELVLEAGGFGLVVIDFGESARTLTHSCALRIARAAERSGAAVIAIAPWRMCGTFAALSLTMSRAQARFSRLVPNAPVMFDGLEIDATVTRNKMGGTGEHARVCALVDTCVPDFMFPDSRVVDSNSDSNRETFPLRNSRAASRY
jgi:hypothetical protein